MTVTVMSGGAKLITCKIGNGVLADTAMLARGLPLDDVRIVGILFEGNLPKITIETNDAKLIAVLTRPVSRWIAPPLCLTPSGKQLFICTNCGRSSVGPDKVCGKGCADAGVSPSTTPRSDD